MVLSFLNDENQCQHQNVLFFHFHTSSLLPNLVVAILIFQKRFLDLKPLDDEFAKNLIEEENAENN